MIYFIRHGETDYNKQGRLQGWLDIPLNDKGVEQANKVSETLKDYKFDIIYSSPLSRALTTAQIVNKYHNVEIITDDRLKEYNVGSRQGEVFGKEWKSIFSSESKSPKEYGAESNDEFRTRVFAAIKEIQDTNKTALVVSHGGVYFTLYKYIHNLGVDQWVKALDNCEIFEIPEITF